MGVFAPLLPIIVMCTDREHAVAVNTLNSALTCFSPHDAHALTFSIQESMLDIANDKWFCPIYAIRKTLTLKETGVWIGFTWFGFRYHFLQGAALTPLRRHAIEKNIRSPLTVEKFTGKVDSAKDTIMYMLHKPGFNFLLHVEGQPIPQPWTLLPRLATGVTVPLASILAPSSPTKSRSIFPSPALKIANSQEHVSRGSGSSDNLFASAQGDELTIENGTFDIVHLGIVDTYTLNICKQL